MLGSAHAAAPGPRVIAPGSASAASVLPASRIDTRAVVVAWCLLSVGISARQGEYSAWGLLAVVAAFALIATVVVRGQRLAAPSRADMAIAVLASLGSAVAHPVGRLMHVHHAGLAAVQVLAAATTAVVAIGLLARRQRLAWLAGLIAAASTGAVVVAVVTDPRIDVWYLLQQSSSGLLHGHDMYRQHWQHSHGLQAVYPYLPMTTVLLAPFRWVFGDVRAGLLLAGLGTSVVLRRLAPAAPAALALLVVAHPHWAFLVDQSWTEPLLLLLIASAVLAVERGHAALAVVCLAGALASKQHVVLLLPVFAAWPAFGWRRAAAAGGLALAAVSPWIVAGPRDFWHDAVHANLALGVIPRALCVPSFLSRHGITVGFWFPLGALALAYVACWLRGRRTAAGVALCGALVMCTIDVTNKQSFFNHYTLPLGLLVVALAAAARELANSEPAAPDATSPQAAAP